MSSHSTSWRLSKGAWAAVAVAFAAEAAANALRAYGLGSHLAQFTITTYGYQLSLAGAVAVLGALTVSLAQTRACTAALTPGHPGWQRTLGAFTAIALLSISVAAMSTHMLAALRHMMGDEKHDTQSSDRAEKAYARAAADYEQVKNAGPVGPLEAQVTTLTSKLDRNIMRNTKDCTSDVSAWKTAWKNECEPVLKLQRPLAEARRKAELEAKLPDLQDKADITTATDQPSDLELKLANWWSWGISFMIVFVATAGPALFGHAVEVEVAPKSESGTSDNPKSDAETPTTPRPRGRGGRKADRKVIDFAARFEQAHGRRPAGSEIKAAFPELPKSTAYDYAKRRA